MNLDRDIDECNEIIANFMGYVFKKGKFYTEFSNSSGEYYYDTVEDEIWWNENGHQMEDGLMFYSKWSELMKVVEKIEGLDGEQYEVDIFGNCCHISNVGDNSYGPDIEVVGGQKREAVYEACYKFIVEYQRTRKSNQ